MDLPEAARGRLAERAGLEHLRGGGRRGRVPAGTGWGSAGGTVATRGSVLLQVLIDFSVVEVFFPLGVLITLSAEITRCVYNLKVPDCCFSLAICMAIVMLTQDESFGCDV